MLANTLIAKYYLIVNNSNHKFIVYTFCRLKFLYNYPAYIGILIKSKKARNNLYSINIMNK
jgi:hypothetical protein